MGGWAVLVLAALVVGGTVSLPTHTPGSHLAPATAPSTTTWVNVSATADYGYSPDTIEQVPTNATVVLTLTDNDPANMQHSLNISSAEGVVIPNSFNADQLDHFFGLHPSLVALLVNHTGDVATKSFRSPATAGWYEFVCNISGHFQNGMYGFIAFGMNLPSNISPSNRTIVGGGLSFSAVDAAVLGGVVVVLVLGYAVWWRPRSAKRRQPGPPGPPRGK